MKFIMNAISDKIYLERINRFPGIPGLLLIATIFAPTSAFAGLDTQVDPRTGIAPDETISVGGQQVGDWSTQQLSITGGLSTTDTVQVGQVSTPTTGSSCSTPGALRYNPTTNDFEGCSGSPSTWRHFGGGSGWVALPPGSISSMILFPSSPMTPDAWCQSKGYASFAGPCRDTGGRPGFEGDLMSNNQQYPWHWSCLYGNGANIMTAATEILCTN